MLIKEDGVYGTISVCHEVFINLPESLLIGSPFPHSYNFMCANEKEVQFVRDLGVRNVDEVVCDYYRFVLENT